MTPRRRSRTCSGAVLGCLLILSAAWAYGQLVRGTPDRLTVAVPGAAWVVEIRTPGFTVQRDEVSSDRRCRYVYAIGEYPDVSLSVRLERAVGNRTPEECRRYAWGHLRSRSPFRMDDVTTSETKQLAILEYRVMEFGGVPVEQKHLHGYLMKDDVCVEIHVSKVRATAADPLCARMGESAPCKASQRSRCKSGPRRCRYTLVATRETARATVEAPGTGIRFGRVSERTGRNASEA